MSEQSYTIVKCRECGQVWHLPHDEVDQSNIQLYTGSCPHTPDRKHVLTVEGNYYR